VKTKVKGYLETKMPYADEITVEDFTKMAYGQSRETYFFKATWKENGQRVERDFVIRRDSVGGVVEESDREFEYRILKFFENTPVPVAKAYWVETDPSILERPFMVMERKEGWVSPAFQVLGRGDDRTRITMGQNFVQTLVAIHQTNWQQKDISFLRPPISVKDAPRQEIAKWERIFNKIKIEPEPLLTCALVWLNNNMPVAENITIVHGDYKADNIMFSDTDIVAVLDWELATLGDPMEDVGWICMDYYKVDNLVNGLMSKEEFLQRYQELTGFTVDPEVVRFWQLFGCFKMAVITLTGIKNLLSGKTNAGVIIGLGIFLPKLYREILDLMEQ